MSTTSEPPVKMTVSQFQGVALWSWDLNVDNCAICRNHIMDLCIECQAAVATPAPSSRADNKPDKNKMVATTMTECPVAWGECNHAFHKHCIQKWLQTRKVCPLDNKGWTYQDLKAAPK
jgi:RING-box protein 1